MEIQDTHAAKRRLPKRKFMRHLETHAMKIRQAAGIGLNCKLDPFALEAELQIKIAYPEDIESLPPGMKADLATMDASIWSGGAWPEPLPNGNTLVILNSNQTPERARVTIMEEVAHTYYGHKPTKLMNDMPRLEYAEKDEQEAYWTAAAALLPSKGIAMGIWLGKSAEEIATAYGTSTELAEMRIKTLGLWKHYNTKDS